MRFLCAAALAIGLAACGSASTGDAPMSISTPLCTDRSPNYTLEYLGLPPGIGAVEEIFAEPSANGGATKLTVLDAVGAPFPAQSSSTGLTSTDAPPEYAVPYVFLAYTQGSIVRLAVTAQAIAELYGRIDTPAKASLIVKLHRDGYSAPFPCGAVVSKSFDGFVFDLDEPGACGVIDHVRIHVASDGAYSVSKSSSGPSGC